MNNLDLSPRVVSFRTDTGSVVDSTVHPLEYRHPVLAAELADALVEMQKTFGLADGTMYHYRRGLENFLGQFADSVPRATSLSRADASVVEALHEWESSLGRSYSAESHIPYSRGRQIRRLIQVRVAGGREVSEPVLRWARGPILHQGGESRPLDEFSNAERLAIRDVCRDRIRKLEARLSRGRQLLLSGKDPRNDGWVRPANVLWGVRWLGRTDDTSIFDDVARANKSGTLNELDGEGSGGASIYRSMDRALSYLYPTDQDLIAFRTLLQLETGAAPEEWSGVTIQDIKPSSDALHVRLHKARAHRSRTIRCATTDTDTDKGWKAGDLVRRLIAVTEHARSEATSMKSPSGDALFLTVQRTIGRSLEPRATPFHRQPFSALLATISPEVSQPHDARRLRKTVKSIRAAVLRSADSAAGDDHSIAVYQRHYAQSTTVHVLAGTAVNAAQEQVFDRLRNGPLLVKSPASVVATDESGALSSAAAEELSSSTTDRAMSVAQCSSPYESPFSPTGRLCEHRPSMCFACPNAIVFSDHLPRVLAYREILRGHEKEMPPGQFAAVHGQQLMNVERILQEFPANEIHAAEAQLNDIQQTVHVPLTQRGTHL
ncbi:hypothetical protein DC31_05715 [Microbacterium sp. CH12i]|uniref:hypothetical protein n=1 Tax=Microbacterium sp. CH12i TaxID=1479651 RepID=UPI000461F7D7|nr:hypothetical protein [Microbacterium sp. CH12i]KDA04642.1 hypothetical protein DC31_05715 [Microbacterium sp. CH12i]